MLMLKYGPGHEILVIAYGKRPLLNDLADVYSRTRGLNFAPDLLMHPYFVYASREGSGESAQHICAGSLEPLLLGNAISTKISFLLTIEPEHAILVLFAYE